MLTIIWIFLYIAALIAFTILAELLKMFIEYLGEKADRFRANAAKKLAEAKSEYNNIELEDID